MGVPGISRISIVSAEARTPKTKKHERMDTSVGRLACSGRSPYSELKIWLVSSPPPPDMAYSFFHLPSGYPPYLQFSFVAIPLADSCIYLLFSFHSEPPS